jgi:ribosomal protein S18 acetylase RimI-like enzyme
MASQSGPPFPLVQLAEHHNVQEFTSGKHPGSQEIDDYLKSSALTEQAAGLSSVWIAIDARSSEPGDQVAGYFTLSPLSVQVTSAVLDQLGLHSVTYRAVGGYLLGRLGVAARLQGQELGSLLVAAAIKKAKHARDDAGGVFLAVDPKNDKLLAWYERFDFGFRRLTPNDRAKRRLIMKL